MKQKYKFMISEGLILWSFSCAFNTYTAAAAGIGILAATVVLFLYEAEINRNDLRKAMSTTMFLLVVLRCSGLLKELPVLMIPVMANVLQMIVTKKHWMEAIDKPMNAMLAMMVLGYISALFLPHASYSLVEMLSVVTVIFMPVCGIYMKNVLRQSLQ